ncbi:MAG: TolC family protein [Kiritimatiellae bacterium]|nr:TolC family protein [Kiritimatiellia bacterium]
MVAAVAVAGGCRSAGDWRDVADEKAARVLGAVQRDVTGREEPVQIETPAQTLRRRLLLDQGLTVFNEASLGIRDLSTNAYWNGAERLQASDRDDSLPLGTNRVLTIGLKDAVQIAARGSRDYQGRKESLFTAALGLDLENQKFRTTFTGMMNASVDSSESEGERETRYGEANKVGASRTFADGTQLSSAIAVDLAGMLSGEKTSSWGLLADASISIPLMRGSGRLVNMESLTQAQRDLVYTIREFEQYKRDFMVGIASAYLNVLLTKRMLVNEEENYKRVIISTRRSRRMADANRMSPSDFDQSRQSELSARNSWISAFESYDASLEAFKGQLGLPPDARIDLADQDLEELQAYVEKFAKTELGEYDAGEAAAPLALERPKSVDEAGALKDQVDRAIALAVENRLDFRSNIDRIEDAQRQVLIAEDALRAEVTLGGRASAGEGAKAGSDDNGEFNLGEAVFGSTLSIDLPFERTAERNAYRGSLIQLEGAVRAYQAAEDALKESVRAAIRSLRETREQLKIQYLAVSLAERRVRNNDLLLQAGRAEMRDVLEAQAALLSAQNALFSAIRSYRVRELELQKELGLLEVTIDGVWREPDMQALGVWGEF